MKCPECGNEYMDHLATCPVCYEKARAAGSDTDSFRYSVLGFFLPPIGWTLHKMWLPVSPVKARTVQNGAKLGFAIWTVCMVILSVVLLAAEYVD